MAEHFTSSEGNNKTSSSIIPDWKNIHLEEISNSQEFITVIPVTVNNNRGSSRILMLKINEVVHAVIFTKHPKKNQKGKFSGNLGISTLDGKFLYGYKVRNGVILSKYIPRTDKSTLAQKQSEPCADYVQGEDWNCGDLEEVIIDSKADDDEIPIIYIYPPSGSDPLTGGTDSGWDYTDGGSKSRDGSTDEDNPLLELERELTAEGYEDNIDDSNLDECLKALMVYLKGHSHGVGELIEAFAKTNDYVDYSWVMASGNLNSTQTAAKTAETDIYTGNTTFNSGAFPKATDLSWMRTILHEAVHSYVVQLSRDKNITFEERRTFLGENWFQAYLNGGHEYIASNYVNSIADILQEYGQIKGYSYNRSFYEDLAWGGLEGTDAFKNLKPATQDRIKDNLNAELNGTDRHGNTKTPKGKDAGC